MNIIDSSLIISYFRKEEENHANAVEWIEKLSNRAITDYILLEVATVLLFKEGKEIASRAIDILVKNKDIEFIRLTNDELQETIKRFQKQNKNLSFVDISLLVLEDSRGMNICTFDKKLLKESKK